MHALIAVPLIVGWAAISIYALWCAEDNLVIIRYAPEPPPAERDDYDLARSANQDLPVAQTAKESIDELHGDRERS